jgi:hypothetical protein
MLKKEKEKKKEKKRKDNVTYKLNSIHGCAYQHLIFILFFILFFIFLTRVYQRADGYVAHQPSRIDESKMRI